MDEMQMTTEEQIADCENKLLEAMRANDIAVLDELLHEDLIFNGPGGHVITKTMDIDAHRAGMIVIREMHPGNSITKIFGDTAVVSVEMAVKGEFFGNPGDGRFHYIRTWKKYGTAWKIIGGACAMLS